MLKFTARSLLLMTQQALVHKGSYTTQVTLPHKFLHGGNAAKQACMCFPQITQLLTLKDHVHLIAQTYRTQRLMVPASRACSVASAGFMRTACEGVTYTRRMEGESVCARLSNALRECWLERVLVSVTQACKEALAPITLCL